MFVSLTIVKHFFMSRNTLHSPNILCALPCINPEGGDKTPSLSGTTFKNNLQIVPPWDKSFARTAARAWGSYGNITRVKCQDVRGRGTWELV